MDTTQDTTRFQVEALPGWARRRPLRKKNLLSQVRLTLRAVRHFPMLIKQMEKLELQTS